VSRYAADSQLQPYSAHSQREANGLLKTAAEIKLSTVGDTGARRLILADAHGVRFGHPRSRSALAELATPRKKIPGSGALADSWSPITR
jgi:hypothetical protein